MKSVQDDSGHAQLNMVADVYSHIIDDDRYLNAQRIEEAFYSGQRKQEEHATISEIPQIANDGQNGDTINTPGEDTSDVALLMRLLQKPEMAQLLKTLAQSL